MSWSNRRSNLREHGKRFQYDILILGCEGKKTEKEYFDFLRSNLHEYSLQIEYLNKKDNGEPKKLLKKMRERIAISGIRKSDLAWIVVDKDQWPLDTLEAIEEWSREDSRYGFALSNPNFEYWLLLHFEDAQQLSGTRDVKNRLNTYITDYCKTGKQLKTKINQENIRLAIKRGKEKISSCDAEYPYNSFGSTICLLVEKILK